LVVVIAVFSFTVAWAASKSKPTVFRWADHSPATSLRAKTFEQFKKRVEKETGGRVKFEIYYSGTLVTYKESIYAVKKGMADITTLGPSKHKTDLPHWQVFGTITSLPEGRAMQKLMTRAIEEVPKLAEDYRKMNQKVFAIQPLPYSALFMGPSLNTLWDVKGRTIRVYAPTYGKMLSAIGALPVSMPFAECYMGLQRGAIDGVHTHVEGGHRFRLQEVNKSILLLKTWAPGPPNMVSVNLDSFNKLSKADQKIFQDAADDILSDQFVDLQKVHMGKIFADFAKAKVKIVDVPAADIAKWLSDPKIRAMQDTWGKKAGATGMLKQVRQLVDESMK
jgi:TRAP-type C4-dicarboxylate transport system substrate-binding protein